MKTNIFGPGLLTGVSTLVLAAAASFSAPLSAQTTPSSTDVSVVPNEDTDSENIVDSEGEFDGVGMIVSNVVGQGGIGICTGTLINPRTVLFAAHCVNSRPATDYDGQTVRTAVGFNADAFPGILDWFGTSASNPDLQVFNVSQIQYDPRSLEAAGGLNFVEADIAIATLDTPAANIPTWALLFSPLPDPGAIDPVNGTGYFVDITGYGGTGTATDGAIFGIDFRRRAAENILGGLSSLDDRNNIIFGPGPEFLPQNLYVTDFDPQDRNSPEGAFSFNVHRDDARPNEGTTAGGDSGGPLILDAENNAITNEDLVIGVLSGGSRFFGGQPFSSIGGTSFYQPLFLYWEYISATNPYRYVGTVGGDGAWEDANHWVTQLDPAYRIIDDSGAIVNGMPTTPELATDGTEGDFGEICFQVGSPFDFCTDTATGITTPVNSDGQATASNGEITEVIGNNVGWYDFDTGIASQNAFSDTSTGPVALQPEFAEEQAQESDNVLPMPTLENGLVGATGFVPDNIDPTVSSDPTLAVAGRYFDVTLGGEGTTTLSSEVEIDRLTVRDVAGLDIDTAGNLTSLINISQFGGTVNVDGVLSSAGDFTLFGGMLSGNGTVETPFLTNLVGAISPGEMGSIGTLTIDGNLILSSGATFLADISGANSSDTIAVTGIASVGGLVGIGSGIFNQVNGNGQTYTILTADGGVTGAFQETSISAILSQSFSYTDTEVFMTIDAASYASAIDNDDPIQVAYAQLFDQNRANAAMSDLFALDFADATTIQDTFRSLAPVNEASVKAMTQQSVNLLQGFNDQRLREGDQKRTGGTIAVTGAPLQTLAASTRAGQPINGAELALQGNSETTTVTEGQLPENMAVYLAGGRIQGDVDSLPGFTRSTDTDGFYLATGIEFYPSENTMVGLSGYFSEIDAKAPLAQTADSQTLAASVYASHQLDSGLILDGQLSLGQLSFDTNRTVNLLGNEQTLTSESSDLLFSGGIGLSYDIPAGEHTFSPVIEFRYARVELDTTEETGGSLALQFDRDVYDSTQGRAGFDYELASSGIQVNSTAQLVWEFTEGPQLLGAQFVNGTGPSANFVINGNERTWGEVGAYVAFGDGPFTIGLGVDTTIGRSRANTQVVRADATFRF